MILEQVLMLLLHFYTSFASPGRIDVRVGARLHHIHFRLTPSDLASALLADLLACFGQKRTFYVCIGP